jgi:hypothetical protein
LAVFLLFWLPFLAVFCGLGVRFALAEHARIASFRSVEAEVLSKRVEQRMFQEESGKVRPVYWPVVEYRYRVDGAVLTSRKVLSEAEEGSEPWARGIADGFEVGQVVRAYYDPERPGEAFLLPHPNLALILILIPIPVACAGYRVFIRHTQGLSRGEMAVMALVWNIAGLAVFGDYFWLAGWAYSYVALRVAVVYGAVGVIMATLAFPQSAVAERLRWVIAFALAGGVLGLLVGAFAFSVTRFIREGQSDWTVWAVCGAKIGAWILGALSAIPALLQSGRPAVWRHHGR